jgi:hypothetical protein
VQIISYFWQTVKLRICKQTHANWNMDFGRGLRAGYHKIGYRNQISKFRYGEVPFIFIQTVQEWFKYNSCLSNMGHIVHYYENLQYIRG